MRILALAVVFLAGVGLARRVYPDEGIEDRRAGTSRSFQLGDRGTTGSRSGPVDALTTLLFAANPQTARRIHPAVGRRTRPKHMVEFSEGDDGEFTPEVSTEAEERVSTFMISALAAALAFAPAVVSAAPPDMYVVDKTGPIGFLANLIEICIDAVQKQLSGLGVSGAYGFSIILLTFFIKLITIPLLATQTASTMKMQKLQPIQKLINEAYSEKEANEKNEMMSKLFQSAKMNPLAGCLPGIVQIPIFISLYRSLQNLIAENKLTDGFLWVPSLEGPVSGSGGMDWITSVFSGNPTWGYLGTLQYLALAVTLYVVQAAAIKFNQPPRADPDGPLTDQEAQGKIISAVIPLIITFFSLNVPAGMSIYWICNSFFTTVITLAIKASNKDVEFPYEVQRIREMVERKSGSMSGAIKIRSAYSPEGGTTPVPVSAVASELSFDSPVDAEMNIPPMGKSKKKKRKTKKNKRR
jgi:YidC/Oxa1 family membrane protein insertase